MTAPSPSRDIAGLTELLERVEAADGPLKPDDACRLDAMSWGRTLVSWEGPHRGDGGEDEFSYTADAGGSRRRYHLPQHERADVSINAAVALVDKMLPPHAIRLSRGHYDRPAAELLIVDEGPWNVTGYGTTMALAVCAALLRALARDRKEER